MSNPKKTATERLTASLLYSGYTKTLVAALAGLGYSFEDIADITGMEAETVKELKVARATMIKAVREDPDASRAFLLRKQQDMALAKGFALSHSPTATHAQLRSVAGTASIIAKSTGLDKPASPQTGATSPKPPPSRPA